MSRWSSTTCKGEEGSGAVPGEQGREGRWLRLVREPSDERGS